MITCDLTPVESTDVSRGSLSTTNARMLSHYQIIKPSARMYCVDLLELAVFLRDSLSLADGMNAQSDSWLLDIMLPGGFRCYAV